MIKIYENKEQAKATIEEIFRRVKEIANEFQIYEGTLVVSVPYEDPSNPGMLLLLGRKEFLAEGVSVRVDRPEFARLVREKS